MNALTDTGDSLLHQLHHHLQGARAHRPGDPRRPLVLLARQLQRARRRRAQLDARARASQHHSVGHGHRLDERPPPPGRQAHCRRVRGRRPRPAHACALPTICTSPTIPCFWDCADICPYANDWPAQWGSTTCYMELPARAGERVLSFAEYDNSCKWRGVMAWWFNFGWGGRDDGRRSGVGIS
jgi:hypothetical protein